MCYVCFYFPGAKVEATTGTGDTALTYACENGHTDVAEALLECGANLVGCFVHLYLYTPYHFSFRLTYGSCLPWTQRDANFP